MIKHDLPVDSDFPFASGLHELIENSFGCSIDEIGSLCEELTNKYVLPVEPIGEVKGEVGVYYLRVPDKLSETQIGWIHEIISYHKPVVVKCILVQSDESTNILLDLLQLELDIEKELVTLLMEQQGKKIVYNDKGFKLIRDALSKVYEDHGYISIEVKEQFNWGGNKSYSLDYTYQKVEPVSMVEIRGELEL